MRLKFDSAGYVCCVLYGCTTDGCAEYEGTVPTEPEAYTDIDDWADRAKVQAYYLNSSGNLTYDATVAATIPDESDNTNSLTAIFNAIYPVGSIYITANPVNPSTLFGGSWVQIKDRFLLAAGTEHAGGSESSEGVSSTATVDIPAHKHLTPITKAGDYLGAWTSGASKSVTSTSRIAVSGGSYSNTVTGTSYYTKEDGACSAEVTIPPTLPPYLAVYVWQRVADTESGSGDAETPVGYATFVVRDGNNLAVEV